MHIKPYLRLAGLEPLVIRPETNFVNVEKEPMSQDQKIRATRLRKTNMKKPCLLLVNRLKMELKLLT
jgi:5-methyltetrahydrofolate--homocysteine methyltransferase